MEKLQGQIIRTKINEVKLRQMHPFKFPFKGIAYFHTNIEHSKCLICQSNNRDAQAAFHRIMYDNAYDRGVSAMAIPHLGSYVCYGETTMLSKKYLYVLLVKIKRNQEVQKIGSWLTNNQILMLSMILFKVIENLKERNMYFGDLHPKNIFTNVDGNFNIIGGFFSSKIFNKNQYLSQFPQLISQLQNSYLYYSPEILSNENYPIDYKSDMFVAGCIIYEIITGKYPFQDRESILTYRFSDSCSLLSGFQDIFKKIFCSYEKRAQPEEVIKILKLQEETTCFQTTKFLNSPLNSDDKSSGFQFFDGIQKFFNKLTKETQGAFLKFAEPNNQKPDEKNFTQIVIKIHKEDDRVHRFEKMINKYVTRAQMLATYEDGNGYFLMKTALLIYRFLRQGPQHDFIIWMEIIEKISQRASSLGFILTFCKIIKTKIELHLSFGEKLAGNFYFDSIEDYFEIKSQEVSVLARYCDRIVTYIGKMTVMPSLTQAMKTVLHQICNQIHNSISILIYFILAIKKDNILEIRQDNLQEFKQTQKQIQSFLKKIDLLCQQSNQVSSHPLYSLQTGYHWYQEQLYLSQQPSNTSFQCFFLEYKVYKGLEMPINMVQKYNEKQAEGHPITTNQKPQSLKKFKEKVKFQTNYKSKKLQEPKECFTQRKKQKKVPIPQKRDSADLSTRSDKKIEEKLHTIFEDFSSTPKEHKNQESQFDLENSDIYSYDWLKRTQKVIIKHFKQPQVDAVIHYLCQDICKGLKLKELIQTLQSKKKFILDPSKVLFDKIIGSGSAGQVYIGKYQTHIVAIKKVKTASNPSALKQFQREVLTYLKIGQHPNLVSMIGLTKFQDNYFLLTQFCEGGSLFDLLHKKVKQIKLSWKQKIKLAQQIAEGMLTLHLMKPPILHRDLKSLNVFIAKKNGQWTSKVADFGLSRCPDTALMTSALGTLHWMAPQLLENKQYSLKIDVYSFGVCLWEICSRRTPYHNLKTPMAIVKHVVVEKQRPLMQLISEGCPETLRSLMKKCWSHSPEHRPSFQQIVIILTQQKNKL